MGSKKRKAYMKEYNKNYNSNVLTKEKKREYNKNYYEKNKERLNNKKKDYMEEYRKTDNYKTSNRKSSLKFKNSHRDKINKNAREYSKRPDVKVRLSEYYKKRLKEDLVFAVVRRLRVRLYIVLEKYLLFGKVDTISSKGINYKAIIEHLKPFPKDLSKYHVDHIKPLCSFELINEDGSQNIEEIQKAFAPKNHQWLTVQENLSKGGKY